VRLLNIAETAGEAKLTCWRPLRAAYLANLNEQPQEQLPCSGYTVTARARPKQLVTLWLELE
jgi:hypothetical protein